MTPWLITPCLMPPVLLILCTFYLMLDASCLWSHFSFFAITTSALVINIIKNLSSIFFSLSLFLSFANGFTKSSLSQFLFFLWHFRSSPKFPKSRLWRRVMPLANLSIHLHLISKLLQFINIDTIVVNRWLKQHLQFRDMTKLLLKVSDWLDETAQLNDIDLVHCVQLQLQLITVTVFSLESCFCNLVWRAPARGYHWGLFY